MDYNEYEQTESNFNYERKFNAEIEFVITQLNYIAHTGGRYSRSVQAPTAIRIVNMLKKMQIVDTRTFHFSEWVDNNLVDETFKAIDREDAIKIMNLKYPNHDFEFIQELF